MASLKDDQLQISNKLIALDAKRYADAETEKTGITLTKNGLAREIFMWSWELYKEAGSLAEFKRLYPLHQKKRKTG